MKKEYLAPELDVVKFEFFDETLLRPSSEGNVNNLFDDNDDDSDDPNDGGKIIFGPG